MTALTKNQIILLHEQLINRYGGIHGIRDEGLLDSALNAPFQSFGGSDLYPTVIEKAVRLGYGLTKNHPFHDGNKRIGALAMLTTLDLNHYCLNADSAGLTSAFLDVAASVIDEKGLQDWVISYLC